MRLPSTAISSVYLSIIVRPTGDLKPIIRQVSSKIRAADLMGPTGNEIRGGFRPRPLHIVEMISLIVWNLPSDMLKILPAAARMFCSQYCCSCNIPVVDEMFIDFVGEDKKIMVRRKTGYHFEFFSAKYLSTG